MQLLRKWKDKPQTEGEGNFTNHTYDNDLEFGVYQKFPKFNSQKKQYY
jgi:hypothetical protein